MSNILLEKYLASQFKFGFELEAIKEEEEDNYDVDEVEEQILNDIVEYFGFNEEELNIKHDGSVAPNDDYSVDYPFEWASPTMTFTPKNLDRCIKGLELMMSNGYYTNTSCGFHTHLSFPDITDQDSIWIISQLALDDKMKNDLEYFNGLDWGETLEFFDDEYANEKFLYQIQRYIEHEEYDELRSMFNTDKYRSIRIHPQGTLEWRGPRNFMNDFDMVTGKHSIENFFKLLHSFVMWMSQAISNTDINGMTKNNYFKLVFGEDAKPNSMITNFNVKNNTIKLRERIKKDVKNGNIKTFISLCIQYSQNKENSKYKNILYTYFDILHDLTYEDNEVKNFIIKCLDELLKQNKAVFNDVYDIVDSALRLSNILYNHSTYNFIARLTEYGIEYQRPSVFSMISKWFYNLKESGLSYFKQWLEDYGNKVSNKLIRTYVIDNINILAIFAPVISDVGMIDPAIMYRMIKIIDNRVTSTEEFVQAIMYHYKRGSKPFVELLKSVLREYLNDTNNQGNEIQALEKAGLKL